MSLEDIKTWNKKIKQIEIEDVHKALKNFLNNQNYVIGELKKLRIFYIFFVFLTLIFKDPLSLDFEQLETKSGIKFWLVEDNSLPLVSLSFSFKGGALADGLGKEGDNKPDDISY